MKRSQHSFGPIHGSRRLVAARAAAWHSPRHQHPCPTTGRTTTVSQSQTLGIVGNCNFQDRLTQEVDRLFTSQYQTLRQRVSSVLSSLATNTAGKSDPTRTTLLRKAFVSEMNKRYAQLRKAIHESIVTQDCFGLEEQTHTLQVQVALPVKAFAFRRADAKVSGFMSWLQTELDATIVNGPKFGRGAWTDKYVQTAYRRGLIRGSKEYDVRQKNQSKKLRLDDRSIDSAFLRPIHADRLGLLYTRTFTDLKGIASRFSTEVSRTLTEGMASGWNPNRIAKEVERRLDVSRSYARTLARTEVIRAHHVATVNVYREAGVEGVAVQAEWHTAGDDRVCEECEALEGKAFTLDEVEGLIPRHPNCRCVALPLVGAGTGKVSAKALDDITPQAPPVGITRSKLHTMMKKELRAGVDPAAVYSKYGAYFESKKDFVSFYNGVAKFVIGHPKPGAVVPGLIDDVTGGVVKPTPVVTPTPVAKPTAVKPPKAPKAPKLKPPASGKEEWRVPIKEGKLDPAVTPPKDFRLGTVGKGAHQDSDSFLIPLDKELDKYQWSTFKATKIATKEEALVAMNHTKAEADRFLEYIRTQTDAKFKLDDVQHSALRVVGKLEQGTRKGEGALLKRYLDLLEKERFAWNQYASFLTDKELLTLKHDILERMSDFVGAPPLGNWTAAGKAVAREATRKGADWIDIDMLHDMERADVRILWSNEAGRAQAGTRIVSLYKNSSSRTIAHELGHEIDNLLGGYTHTASGGNWQNTYYATKRDGLGYRMWYTKQHGATAVGANGDGLYWKDNWISEYEGRIYGYKAKDIQEFKNQLARGYVPKGAEGTEWFSMNTQRYFDAHIDAVAAVERGLPPAAWKSSWTEVRERYPELAGLMERLFGDPRTPKRFASFDFSLAKAKDIGGAVRKTPHSVRTRWAIPKMEMKVEKILSAPDVPFVPNAPPPEGITRSKLFTAMKHDVRAGAGDAQLRKQYGKYFTADKDFARFQTSVVSFVQSHPKVSPVPVAKTAERTIRTRHSVPKAIKGDPDKTKSIAGLDKTVDYWRTPRTTVKGKVTEWDWHSGDSIVKDKRIVERMNAMRLPPAWKSVMVSKDPKAALQAIGVDEAGRVQYRYSAERTAAKAREKFDRVNVFTKKLPNLRTAIDEGVERGDAKAFALRLEDRTAIRMGSVADTHAKIKAYGLTTLEKQHVKVKGDTLYLDFIAKKGNRAQYTVKDKVLAQWADSRLKVLKPGQQLFYDVTPKELNSFIGKHAGGKFTIKDFRTFHATRIANHELRQYVGQKLTTAKRKQIVKDVSEKASQFLHNTPTMAKNSYINPMVWDQIGGLP